MAKDNPDELGAGSESLRSALGAIGLLTSVFTINFIARVIISPLMPAMAKDLDLAHGEAGALFLFISLGYGATLLISGFVTAVVTHRRSILISGLAVGLALLITGISQGVWTMRLGLALVGAAGGLYLPSAISTITTLLDEKDWGKGLGVHELAPNISFAAAPLLAGFLLSWFTWREVLMGLGLLGVALAVIFGRWGRGGEFSGQRPDPAAMAGLLSLPSFWIMAILFSLGIGASMGVFAMLPLYLVSEHAFDHQGANYLVAFSRVSGLFMGFVGGWASDRLGTRRALIYIMASTGVLTLFMGLTHHGWLIALVFLQPATAVCFFAPAFAAISRLFDPKQRSLAVSLVVAVAIVVGGGLLPAATGHLAEAGYFGLGFTLAGLMLLGGLIPLALLRMPEYAAHPVDV